MGSFFDLVPDASNLIESQRSVGYTFETAVADIIDNSISALATEVNILFSSHEKYLAVLDNGYGMNYSELIQAMKYGSKSINDTRSKEDLGRFGLGLKMASFSQCRKLTVVSKKNNSVTGAVWDLDTIKKNNRWSLIILDESELKTVFNYSNLMELSSGTLVVWEKFDKLEQHANFELNFDESLERTEDHLSLVFHRFLQEKNLIIQFNNRKISYVDPFFTSNKATQPKSPDTIFEKNRKEQVYIKPYIVPYQSKLSQKEKHILRKYEQNQLSSGLYIYRNYRLIAWGKWFKLVRPNELANLAKIQIDIPNTLDDLWEIDVKKSQLNIPTSLRNQLRNRIIQSIGESERVYRHRGERRNHGNLSYVFDRIVKENKVSYRLNLDNPIIKQLQKDFDSNQNKLLDTLIKQVEEYLPLESIKLDMLDSKYDIESDEDSYEEVYEEIMLLLDNQSTRASKLALLESLKYSEVYSKNLKILERIEGGLND